MKTLTNILIGIIIGMSLMVYYNANAVEMNATVPKSEYYTCLDRCELKCYEKFVY